MARNALRSSRTRPRTVTQKTGRGRKARKAKAVLERPPSPLGRRTTDDDEIALRRWRGRTEIQSIGSLEPDQAFFGTFATESVTGRSYRVEIRDLVGFTNSCTCMDHRVNGLGTCQHVEGVLAALSRGRVRAFRSAGMVGSPRIEVFLDRREDSAGRITWPAEATPETNAAAARLRPHLLPDGTLPADPERIAALVSAWSTAPADLAKGLRVSAAFSPWLGR